MSVRVGDLDEHASAITRSARAHECAQRARDASLTADHLADVIRGDVQDEDERAVTLLLFHANRLRVVDELAREIREQLSYVPLPARSTRRRYFEMPCTLSNRATASVGRAPLPSHSLTFASSNSMVDGSVCGL